MIIRTEFEEPMSILCQVIIWTRFGLYIIKLKVIVTLTFEGINLKSPRDHLNSRKNVCVKFDKPLSLLCLVIIRTRFGLYTNILMVSVTLTFDRLISKSIWIIYTSIQMSVLNFTEIGQFCV